MGYKVVDKIRSFTQLRSWQVAHKMVLGVYSKTKQFPQEEQFGLTSQIRRAAVSIPSNIAEGFSRGSKKEKVQFYKVAKGSLSELQSQIILARDLGYMHKTDFDELAQLSIESSKLLTGIIKSASN